jgi:hypothetical protein
MAVLINPEIHKSLQRRGMSRRERERMWKGQTEKCTEVENNDEITK